MVLNKADNYECRIFADEQTGSYDRDKVKGTGVINFAYRRIHRLTESADDAAIFEEIKRPSTSHIISIAPYWKWDGRRTWYLEFETAEEAEEWERSLRFAAWRARAPLNPNPVKRAAFESAYRQTRRELRVWGYYSSCATEEEMLAFLANDAVEDTIMPPVYASIKSGRAERIIRDKVRETVNNTVGASVRAGWAAASKGIDAVEPKVTEAVTKSLGPILDAVATVENKVAEAASGVIRPAVETNISSVLSPIFELLFGPLAGAHAKAVEVVAERLDTLIAADGGVTGDKGARLLANMRRYASYQWGEFYAPCRVLSEDRNGWGDAARSELAARAPGLSEWRMDRIMREGLGLVCRNAIYTFSKLVTEGAPGADGPMDAAAAKADTLARMAVDCKLAALEDIHTLFVSVIYPLVLKLAKAGLDPIIEPISAAIPEVAKLVINPTTMVDELLLRILGDAIRAGINGPGRAVLDSRMGGLTVVDPALLAKYESDEAAVAAATERAAEAIAEAAAEATAAATKATEAAAEAAASASAAPAPAPAASGAATESGEAAETAAPATGTADDAVVATVAAAAAEEEAAAPAAATE